MSRGYGNSTGAEVFTTLVVVFSCLFSLLIAIASTGCFDSFDNSAYVYINYDNDKNQYEVKYALDLRHDPVLSIHDTIENAIVMKNTINEKNGEKNDCQ